MPAPRKITDEQYAAVEAVLIERRKARAIPSDKHLARSLKLSIRSIRWIVSRMTVSLETRAVTLQQDGCSRPDSI